MEAKTRFNEAEESDAEAESSILSTILADIDQNPTILQKPKNFSDKLSIFSTIPADIEEENPTILQEKNEKLTETRSRGSMKTPIDFTRTVPQTLTHSNLVDILYQELKILKSEMESKGQTSDRFVSRNPSYGRECDCVEERKLEEQREEVRFLAYEVLEWIFRGESDVKSDISTDTAGSVCKSEDGDTREISDEMLSTMLRDENEQVNKAEGGSDLDEFIENMLEKIENDGSYLERIKDEYGDFIEDLLRNKLREKAEKEEKMISTWITDGEPEVETEVAEEKKEEKRDAQKKSPVKVTFERSEQESTVSKRNCFRYKIRLYLIEKSREGDEELLKRRVKAVRFGLEFSYLVAEYMFLIPSELLASEIEDYWICLKRFGVNGDDKGTSVIIGKLEEVFDIVIRKKESKEHDNVNLLESTFRFDDYIPLCVDVIQSLGKIVWALRSNQREKVKLSDLDSLFEDCRRVLMKIELKLAEMKQRVYRAVSADYESFSKSQRFDCSFRRKLMRRVNADSRFGRAVIGSYLVEIWKSLFQAEALQEQRKEEWCEA